jgi:hypothetical protein
MDTDRGAINKTDHHDIAKILLKVVLNTITLTLTSSFQFLVNYTSESVTVEPSVRLVGGKSDASGRLEIQLNPESA